MYKLMLLTSLFLFMSLTANAERSHGTDFIPKGDISDKVIEVLELASSPYGENNIGEIYFSKGLQAYNSDGSGFGPLARLCRLKDRRKGECDVIGYHYMLSSPAWRFEKDGQDVELIADGPMVKKIPGASDQDVSHLYVPLKPNNFGYCAVVRVETRGGKPKPDTNVLERFVYANAYETFYGFIFC